ncbi:MAG: hypothetical protein IT307_07740 [Chloroflexi bacterium]|nr:hypothetical protein [Chloroflexota bacterium]
MANEHWLDEIARELAAGLPRRGALRRLGGGLVGAVLALSGRGEALAVSRPHRSRCDDRCTSNQTCCPDGTCATLSSDPLNCGTCGRKCPTGAVCYRGSCCTQRGDTCGAGSRCCGSLHCLHVNGSPPFFNGGPTICIECGTLEAPCSLSQPCCPGARCTVLNGSGGVCVPDCGLESQYCNATKPCCAPLYTCNFEYGDSGYCVQDCRREGDLCGEAFGACCPERSLTCQMINGSVGICRALRHR